MKHRRNQYLSLQLPVLRLEMLEARRKAVVLKLHLAAGLTQQMDAADPQEERASVKEQVEHCAVTWLLLPMLDG